MRDRLLTIARLLFTAAAALAVGLVIASYIFGHVTLPLGPVPVEIPRPPDAIAGLLTALLVRALLSRAALAVLGRAYRELRVEGPASPENREDPSHSSGWSGVTIWAGVLLLVLFVPQTLGKGIASVVESFTGDVPGQWGDWDGIHAAPEMAIHKCLAGAMAVGNADRPGEPPRAQSILLAGPGARRFQGYLLAYYIYPLRLYMAPADEESMFYSYLDLAPGDDPGMYRYVEAPPVTDAGYRDLIERLDIDHVLYVPGPDPRDRPRVGAPSREPPTILLPANRAFR